MLKSSLESSSSSSSCVSVVAQQDLMNKYIGDRQSCRYIRKASAAVEMRPADPLCHDSWQTDIQKSAADQKPVRC